MRELCDHYGQARALETRGLVPAELNIRSRRDTRGFDAIELNMGGC